MRAPVTITKANSSNTLIGFLTRRMCQQLTGSTSKWEIFLRGRQALKTED